MIKVEDLMEMKNRMELYKNEPHSIVCHPDNYESIIKHAEGIHGRSLSSIEAFRLFGLRILVLPGCPKDKVYMLSKDAIDQLKKAMRGKDKPQDTALYASLRR